MNYNFSRFAVHAGYQTLAAGFPDLFQILASRHSLLGFQLYCIAAGYQPLDAGLPNGLSSGRAFRPIPNTALHGFSVSWILRLNWILVLN